MNEWLKGRLFGMPRWAFLLLLAGGIILGLYLRYRRRAETEGVEYQTEGMDTLTTAEGEAGLAGVGVVSPPGGVYPVSSPVIPEGLTELIGSLAGVISEQGTALVSVPSAFEPQTPVVNVTLPETGGGPPAAPPKTVPSTGPCAGRISKSEYLRRLRSIRDRHGEGSREVQNFRARWSCTNGHCCPR